MRLANIFLPLLIFSLPLSAFAQAAPVPTAAPFSTDATAPASNGSKFMSMYDNERTADAVPPDRPHRTTEQVADWVTDNVTTAMNIDPLNWNTRLKQLTPKFDTYGLQQYQAYLQSSGILAALQTNNLRLNTIADGDSILLSEGALSGSYHWLYQLPLMMSYYDTATRNLKKGDDLPQNRKVMVRVQVGRAAANPAPNTGDDANLVIERWSVTPLQ